MAGSIQEWLYPSQMAARWMYGINPAGGNSQAYYPGDVVLGGSIIASLGYPSVAALQNAYLPPILQTVEVTGYYTPGDLGGGTYVRSAGPAGPGIVQSADGAFWALTGYAFDPRQFGAKGDGVTDDTAAINNACTYANTPARGLVQMSPGNYKTTASINVPLIVTLRGPDFPLPKAAFNPTAVLGGAVIFKAHTGHGVVKTGAAPGYAQCTGIYNIGVYSNYNTYAGGDGFYIDYLGTFEMENCAVWSVGGNAFTIGHTATDVTGNIYLENLYANNPVGTCYNIRARWVTGVKLVSDGGNIGIDLYNGTDCAFYDCHHEGMFTAGVRLSGTTVNNLFDHFYILCNAAGNPSVPAVLTYLIDPGSTANTFRSGKFIGSNVAATNGVTIVGNALNTVLDDCEIVSFVKGVQIQGAGSVLSKSRFFSCALPIEVAADRVKIGQCATETSTTYSLLHTSGTNGNWSGNNFDKPFNPVASGTPGNFLNNLVTANFGVKTRFIGETGSVASGFTLPHGLAGTPLCAFATSTSPFALPADFKLTWDAVNLSATWTGGNLQLSLMAFLVCESAG